MKGHFSRFTHDPDKHYSGVRLQQGKVLLDADFNEAGQIRSYLERTTRRDVIGPCGAPQGDAGFEVTVEAGEVTIKEGRFYVDGILCEFEEDRAYDKQPDLPTASLPGADGVYLFYLDVWDRHITALEDPEIREVALGGPDHGTRVRTISQVKHTFLGPVADADDLACTGCENGLDGVRQISTGTLRARSEPSTGEKPCVLPPKAGFRRLENQLYRVEIHRIDGSPEEATFKWSRNNAALVSRVEKIEGVTLTVRDMGKDELLRFQPQQWVEFTNEERILAGQPGILAQVTRVVNANQLEIGAWPTGVPALGTKPTLRAWEGARENVVSGTWIELEDGVQVQFTSGEMHTGDYWLIPARVNTGDVHWQLDRTVEPPAPVFELPLGIYHHYCALAVLQRSGGAWTLLRDCRPTFRPLADRDCCVPVLPKDDLATVLADVAEAGGGCVCLVPGVHRVAAPLVLDGADNLKVRGAGPSSVLHVVGPQAGGHGLELHASDRISLESMTLVGDDVDDVVFVHGEIGNPCRTLALSELTMVNRTAAPKRATEERTRVFGGERRADSSDGRVEGTVTDDDGNPLPGVTVRISGPAGERMVVTDQNGRYRVTGLGPGTYRVRAELVGFGIVELESVEVGADRDVAVAFNLRQEGPPCALRLADVLDVSIERSTLAAAAGIVASAGYDFESARKLGLRVGVGVADLDLRDSRICHQSGWYGTWAFKATRWDLDGCTVLPGFEPGFGGSPDGAPERDPICPRRHFEELLEDVAEYFESLPETPVRGAAVRALFWTDCTVRHCHLVARTGLSVGFWNGGRVAATAVRQGLPNDGGSLAGGMDALWLGDARLSGNEIGRSNQPLDYGVAFASTASANLDDNTIHAEIGIANVGWRLAVTQLNSLIGELAELGVETAESKPSLQAIRAGVSETAGKNAATEDLLIAGWLVFGEVARRTGYRTIFDQPAGLVFLLLYLGFDDLFGKMEPPLPVADLEIRDNDIQSRDACVLLNPHVPLGGLRIHGNRLAASYGRAVRVNAHGFAANPHLTIALLRLFEFVIRQLDNDQIVKLFGPIFAFFHRHYETDFSIEDNRIRSRQTAVASNLFQLIVDGNHIELAEGAVSKNDLSSILAQFSVAGSTLAPLVNALRDAGGEEALAFLEANTGSEAVVTALANAVDALLEQGVSDEIVKLELARLKTALEDPAQRPAGVRRFGGLMLQMVDSLGIVIRGAGCGVRHNEVYATKSLLQRTAWGGILYRYEDAFSRFFLGSRQSGSAGKPPAPIESELFRSKSFNYTTYDRKFEHGYLAAAEALAPAAALLGLEIDPLLGVSTTAIEDNEIQNGAGMGIHVDQSPLIPGKMLGKEDACPGVSNIRIRGNEIRGMSSTGVFVDEESFAVGLDFEGNVVSDCGSQELFPSQIGRSNGIDIRNAGFVRIHDNRVMRCATVVASDTREEHQGWGLLVHTAESVVLSDNHLLRCGPEGRQGGGVILDNVHGIVSIEDNQFEELETGLYVIGGRALPPTLVECLRRYAQRSADDGIGEPMVTISGNAWRTGVGRLGISLFVAGLPLVDVTANSFQGAPDSGLVARISSLERLVLASNLVRTRRSSDDESHYAIEVYQPNEASLVGNVTGRPDPFEGGILLWLPSGVPVNVPGAPVKFGLNVPDVKLVQQKSPSAGGRVAIDPRLEMAHIDTASVLEFLNVAVAWRG